LFLETQGNETIEEALERTDFEEAWDVLQAMQEQDAVLADIIREMREERGRVGSRSLQTSISGRILGVRPCFHRCDACLATPISMLDAGHRLRAADLTVSWRPATNDSFKSVTTSCSRQSAQIRRCECHENIPEH
jgi:hypothetical protein